MVNIFKKKKKECTCHSIDNSSGLKFRIKEYINFTGNKEIHTFFPQICVESIEKGYRVSYLNSDYDAETDNVVHNWGYLTRSGFDTLEKAKEICLHVKAVKEKVEIKYHNI